MTNMLHVSDIHHDHPSRYRLTELRMPREDSSPYDSSVLPIT